MSRSSCAAVAIAAVATMFTLATPPAVAKQPTDSRKPGGIQAPAPPSVGRAPSYRPPPRAEDGKSEGQPCSQLGRKKQAKERHCEIIAERGKKYRKCCHMRCVYECQATPEDPGGAGGKFKGVCTQEANTQCSKTSVGGKGSQAFPEVETPF